VSASFDPFPRLITLDAGIAMVVTDLHGDWDAYRRYRDCFLTLDARGQADWLILTGDLIHSEDSPRADRSLDIVLDVLALRDTLGERLVYLMGNHELPHLYGVTLSKGEHVYTPRFEAALGPHRARVLALFDALPF
jgi:Icc-related predicted phosphoesterase